MGLLTALGNIAGGIIGLGVLLLQTWLVMKAVRRVLGVPVGWLRAFLVSLVTVLVLLRLFGWVASVNRFEDQLLAHPEAVMLGLLLVLLWGFALGTMALVVLEVVVPSGSLPPLRSLLFGWRRRARLARRYAAVVAIAVKYGLGSQLRGSGGRHHDPDEVPRTAVALRRALDEAGVTFIKFGQMLSTRADLLPEPYVRELSRLQSSAEPLPWESIEPVLADELGRPVAEVFATVDERPLASASVAQVHAATLADGRDVVLKVQRPGALPQVALDLDILHRLARSLEKNAGWARRLGVVGLANGFAASLREEVDYRVELDNMASMRRSLADRSVRVPWVAEDLGTPRLIVMERFAGTPVVHAAALVAELTDEQRAAAATTLLQAVFGQITQEGIFHADLHGGNVVIWPDGGVGLLDFGSVGRLDAVSRRHLSLLLWAIDADDPVVATDALLELLDRPARLDERSLQRSLGILLTRFRGGLGAGGSQEVFTALFRLIIDHGFRVPPAIAAALRSLGALEGTLTLIDPRLDLAGAAREAGRDAIGEVTPERVQDELTARLVHLLPLLETLPRRVTKISEDLETGRFTASIRVLADEGDRVFVAGLVDQLVVSVLAGAAVLGGIALLVAGGGPELMPGMTLFQVAGYLLTFAGFVLSLRAVAQVFGRR